MKNKELLTMATTATASTVRKVPIFGPLQITITILVAVTALVHLFLGTSLIITLTGPTPQDAGLREPWAAILAVLFLCNFGGYLVLITALYLPALHRFQRFSRAALISFAALAIVGYFAIDRSQLINPIGLADKAIEAVLIALLVFDGRRVRR